MNRQEALACSCLAGMILALCALVAVSLWFALPREEVFSLGRVTDFPPGAPQYRVLRSDLAVYVVNLNGQLLAWDAQATAQYPYSCRIKWVALNNRFEDPCSGAKWCADGALADLRFAGYARSLDLYPLEITVEGEVLLHPFRKVPGTPLPEEVRREWQGVPDRFPLPEVYECKRPLRSPWP
jgi:hypothetical protein